MSATKIPERVLIPNSLPRPRQYRIRPQVEARRAMSRRRQPTDQGGDPAADRQVPPRPQPPQEGACGRQGQEGQEGGQQQREGHKPRHIRRWHLNVSAGNSERLNYKQC